MKRSTIKPAESLVACLQKFFRHYLQAQRRVSPCTLTSYADTFRLLMQFVEKQTGHKPMDQSWEDWTAARVLGFLDHLEQERGNSIRSRNARLAAIRSFMRYAGQHPATVALSAQIRAIPLKRFDRRLISFLSRAEMDSLLAACALDSFTGRRDHALFCLLYQTGARISELLALNRKDIQCGSSSYVQLQGKGRKERLVPLNRATSQVLRRWLEGLPSAPQSPVFPACRGQRLTRFGAEKRLRLTVQRAIPLCPSLRNRRITLHMLRHSTAMHLLQAGVDVTVIALWLGHEQLTTTHHYVELDLAMKKKCLRHLSNTPKTLVNKTFKPNDRLLNFLASL